MLSIGFRIFASTNKQIEQTKFTFNYVTALFPTSSSLVIWRRLTGGCGGWWSFSRTLAAITANCCNSNGTLPGSFINNRRSDSRSLTVISCMRWSRALHFQSTGRHRTRRINHSKKHVNAHYCCWNSCALCFSCPLTGTRSIILAFVILQHHPHSHQRATELSVVQRVEILSREWRQADYLTLTLNSDKNKSYLAPLTQKCER